MANWVYIAGRGHSGSTMLDAMLGNAPGIESVGELVSGMGRYDEQCSCGRPFRVCPYWEHVRADFSRRTDRSWDEAVALSKGQAHIKAFPKTLIARPVTPWVEELKAVTDAIGQAIAATATTTSATGTPRSTGTDTVQDPSSSVEERSAPITSPQVIVDSSKEITRALFILRFLPTSRVIHLMRHPVSILQSDYYRLKGGTGFKLLRRRYHPRRFFGPFLFVSVLTWITGNLLADLTRAFGGDRFLRVRYEKIIAEPIQQIDRIEAFLGISMDEVRRRLAEHEAFEVGHNIGGNHMRLAGRFVFDPKKSSRPGLPVRFAVMTWLMTWPLLIAYGYKGRMVP